MTPATVHLEHTRLDLELVRRGLVRSRRRASELVAAGRVHVDGAVAVKPSQPVTGTQRLDVEDDERFVSRAAHKLDGALEALEGLAPGQLHVRGARCLDAGASTGGFTQVLLERGAAHVLAVDVGHGQMAPTVRDDPRVTVREGVNVRGLELDDRVDLVVADLSFISLTLVLAPLLAACVDGGDVLVMVKPQFEVGRERLGAGGVVRSATLRTAAVVEVASTASSLGAQVRAVVPSPLPGESGNHEYFLWLRPGTGGGADEDTTGTAVHRAVVEDRATLVGGGR